MYPCWTLHKWAYNCIAIDWFGWILVGVIRNGPLIGYPSIYWAYVSWLDFINGPTIGYLSIHWAVGSLLESSEMDLKLDTHQFIAPMIPCGLFINGLTIWYPSINSVHGSLLDSSEMSLKLDTHRLIGPMDPFGLFINGPIIGYPSINWVYIWERVVIPKMISESCPKLSYVNRILKCGIKNCEPRRCSQMWLKFWTNGVLCSKVPVKELSLD